ncbi:hypothetical protein VLK31_08765 [Variovorax sp. H27-G14]|uniref:hypothetical protein n=1 Tax=Variovorax sp. H27-G14 TaxID=3111914 RepID=UPI0038FC7237
MAKQIVIRGGNITVASIQSRPNEYTTGGKATSLSVYCGEVKSLDKRTPGPVWEIAKGCAHSKITAVDMAILKKAGAKIESNALPGAPKHCLVSEISIEDFVEIFKKNAMIFEN